MSFTDDDLKRLKNVLNGREGPLCIPSDRFEDLLARLEAAERVIPQLFEHGGLQCNKCVDLVTAWRKAAGK